MAEVTNEPMYELLKRVHHDMGELRMDWPSRNARSTWTIDKSVAVPSNIHPTVIEKSPT